MAWGYVYAEGEGVPQDDTEAIKWYRRAVGAYREITRSAMKWHRLAAAP